MQIKALSGDRTHGLKIRSLPLYPTELSGQNLEEKFSSDSMVVFFCGKMGVTGRGFEPRRVLPHCNLSATP